MHHAYFGKIRINESQGKYCVEAPDCNPFQSQLELNNGVNRVPFEWEPGRTELILPD